MVAHGRSARLLAIALAIVVGVAVTVVLVGPRAVARATSRAGNARTGDTYASPLATAGRFRIRRAAQPG